jgi:peptidoglycan hydrolase-like protein with peptidoglycan-binding domain
MAAVETWQADNGLPADGKFGKNSLAKYQAIAKANQEAALVNSQNPADTPTDPV